MIIEELELENFVSHRKTKMKFDLGVTLIVGSNGAGKTSILDGISFALFKLHSRGKDENVVNRRAKHAKVGLKFSVPGKGQYVVEWNIEKKKKGCDIKGVIYELTESGRHALTREAGSNTLLPEIAKILDVKKETFESSVYVRQGEIEKLVVEDPAERKRLISKLLGIDDFEQAWSLMKEIVDEYDKRLERLRGELSEKERVLGELERLRGELADVEGRIGELETLVRELEEERARVEERLRRMEEVKRKFDELKVKLAEVKAELDKRKEKVRAAEKDLKMFEELRGEVERRGAGYERYVALEREVERLGQEKKPYEGARDIVMVQERETENLRREEKKLEERLSSMMLNYSKILGVEVSEEEVSAVCEREKARVEEEIKVLTKRRRELEEKVGELEGRIRDNEDKVRRLKEAEARCPLCGKELTEEHKERLLRELLENLERLRREKERVAEEAREVERRLEEENRRRASVDKVDGEAVKNLKADLEEKRKRRREVEAELEEARSKLERLVELERLIDEAKREAEGVRADYEAYISAESQLRRLGDENKLVEAYTAAVREVEEAERELSAVEKEMSELGYDEREYEATREELEKVRAKLEEKRRELASLRGEEKKLRDGIERHRARIKELEEKETEARKLESFVELLKRIREAYGKDGVQKLIRARARPAIEAYTRDYLNRFNLEYSDVRLDEDYKLTVIGPSGSQSVDAVSGGERVALAIALRMAVAKVIAGNRISTMIMDEPTVFLDEERRRELIEILKRAFREEAKVVPQLIIVSHDRELEEAADVVYTVTKEGGWSKVEEVEAGQRV